MFLGFDTGRMRYRPVYEISHATVWSLFGATPWMHHLSRWILHFGTILTWCAAFRCFSGKSLAENSAARAEREKLDHLLALAFLVYVWVFFPNSPASRLSVPELQTVFFLGLCTWMTARALSKKNGEERTFSSISSYIAFCTSYAGLCWSKEVNVGVALWILIFYCVFLVPANSRKKIMMSVPLALIFFHTVGMVYVLSKTFGRGYKGQAIPRPFHENAIRTLEGLFQVETSLVLTIGFAILSAIPVAFVVIKIVNRSFDSESLFVLFLLGQFMSLFSILSLSWGVTLRYWYVLIPAFAMLLAFSVKFILRSVRGCRLLLAGFVVFFVTVNYSNFLFQTIIQHSLRNTDTALISKILLLVGSGKHVQIDYTGDEMEGKLIFDVPEFFDYFYNRNLELHEDEPEAGTEYFLVTRKNLPIVGDGSWTVVPQMNSRIFSYASTIANILQGGAAFLALDAGAHFLDQYRFNIYPMKDGGVKFSIPSGKPQIRSEFDVYFSRNQNTLTYVREPCREEDLHASFFLHIVPVDIKDIPDLSKDSGFENRDFGFNDHGLLDGGKCVGMVVLPDFPISKISTGQYTPDGTGLWGGEVELR